MNRLIVIFIIAGLVGCDQAANNGDAGTEPNASVGEISDRKPEGIKSHVFQFGIYKAVSKGQIKKSATTNTGKVIRKPKLEHVSMTDRIPLVKETYFGYQYRLFNLPPDVLDKPVIKLRKVLVHPQMTLPDGTTATGWDQTFKGRVENQQVLGFDGYAFNEDYELVEGDWIFQVWYKDKKLVERKFIAVRPEQEQATAATE